MTFIISQGDIPVFVQIELTPNSSDRGLLVLGMEGGLRRPFLFFLSDGKESLGVWKLKHDLDLCLHHRLGLVLGHDRDSEPDPDPGHGRDEPYQHQRIVGLG